MNKQDVLRLLSADGAYLKRITVSSPQGYRVITADGREIPISGNIGASLCRHTLFLTHKPHFGADGFEMKPRRKFGDGQIVLVTLDAGEYKITGADWVASTKTWMYRFEGSEMRCGEQYLREKE